MATAVAAAAATKSAFVDVAPIVKYAVGQTVRGRLGSYTFTHQLYRDRVWRAINGKRDNVIVKTAPEAWQLQNESGVLKAYQDKTPHLRRLIDEVEGTEGPQALVLEHLDDDMLNFCTAEKLSSKELKQVARSALEALKILHEGGDVHTDVKPSNIVANRSRALARFEEVKLIDFAECHPIGHENLLDGGEFGTAIFRAPEVQLQLRNLGPPMDIWSLGATLISLALGRNFHILQPSRKIDEVGFSLEILLKTLTHFGPWPTSFLDLCYEEALKVILFTMEVCPPETWALFRNTMESQIRKEDRDFISKMMVLDPRERPSPQQLLQDEWFKEAPWDYLSDTESIGSETSLVLA